MTTAVQAEVKVSGSLSCIDSDGARPLTPEEFHDVIGRMADHLDTETRITDPTVWGQAATGEMEIYFLLPAMSRAPALLEQTAHIIGEMGDAVGLVWANDPRPPRSAEATPVLSQTSQSLDLIPAPA
jgi:hypothetical protein